MFSQVELEHGCPLPSPYMLWNHYHEKPYATKLMFPFVDRFHMFQTLSDAEQGGPSRPRKSCSNVIID